MTDLEKIQQVIINQQERGIASNDWERLTFSIHADDEEGDRQVLKIPELQVGFMFTRRGRFVGAYNWKE